MLQLPQADGTEVQGPPQDLVQAECPLHDAAEPAAVPQAEEVAELVARDLREKAHHALEPYHSARPWTPGQPHQEPECPGAGQCASEWPQPHPALATDVSGAPALGLYWAQGERGTGGPALEEAQGELGCQTRVHTPTLPLHSCATSGKGIGISVPWFLYSLE